MFSIGFFLQVVNSQDCVVKTGFKHNARKLAKCWLNLKNACRKIKHSNLFVSPIFRPFYVGQSESRRQEMRGYCLCAVMICNKHHVIQSCDRIIPGSGKIKVVIRIVPRCTLVYITDILPMYIRNVAIVMLGIFHEELSVLI